MLIISVLQPSETSGDDQSPRVLAILHIQQELITGKMGTALGTVTCPMSRSGCTAPPFMFTHYLCINAPGWPIPRGSKAADTLLRLQKVTEVHWCGCRAGPCQPMEGWLHADIPLSWSLPGAASVRCKALLQHLEVLSEVFARLVQDLVRWGACRELIQGQLTLCGWGGCLWPSCFRGER